MPGDLLGKPCVSHVVAEQQLTPPLLLQERKYVETHKSAMHKALPTAFMNKAFAHYKRDQSENSVGSAGHRQSYNSFV